MQQMFFEKLSIHFLVAASASAFTSPTIHRRRHPLYAGVAATSVDNVVILPDADAVGNKVRGVVYEAAKKAIGERGYFSLAIPGGSILNMLIGDDILGDWTEKTTIAYVNHKCVDMNDGNLATHAKARKLFLDSWKGANTLVLDGTDQGEAEAASYEAKMKELTLEVLPRDASGLPIFDLALIGVGDDGHIGSLYPGRNEVLVGSDGPWVLPVAMKDPPSITFSLPIMANSKQVIIAACGVSDKYPQGKSAGMRRAVAADDETLQTFPAVGLRSVATWVMDEAAASKLGEDYIQK
uniref:Glucosamine/galactosamine-6-phosphate isomerase domain-containing protein n=1 Tax=Octactis speculum TaxID=3111310 RepID=A0A7S2BY35_9STRA